MVILSVDFGDVRTGLAICDRDEMMASGAGCIKASGFKTAVAAVAERAVELKAELIVVGNPINMNGTEGERSERCRDFARELESASGIKTTMYDERLTTVSAHKFLTSSNVKGKRHKQYVDELSAQLILEDFLARRKSQNISN